jgi:hypothetical protein
MLDSEKLAIAAHLHVAVRRKLGRVTDVEWLVRSEEYAREIVRLALAEPGQPEMHAWALRLLATLTPPSANAVAGARGPAPAGWSIAPAAAVAPAAAPRAGPAPTRPQPWPRETRPDDLRPLEPEPSQPPPRYVGGLR